MSLNGVRRRWQVSAVGMTAVAAVALLVSGHGIAANEAAKEEVALGADLAERVQVDVSERLRYTGGVSYQIEFQVANTSDEPLEGPVLLVVDGTGLEGLEFVLPDGKLKSGEPYFIVVREGQELAAEATTPRRKLLLEAPERLTFSQLNGFELEYRVVRAKFHRERQAPRDRDEPVVRRPGLPAGPGQAGSGRNHEAPGEPEAAPEEEILEPIPEVPDAPPRRPRENEPRFPEEEVNKVIEVQDRWSDRLMAIEGVHGTATGYDKDGNLAVVAHIERHGIRHDLPKELEGTPVIWKVTGTIREYAGPPPRLGQAGGHTPRPTDPERPDLTNCLDFPGALWPYSIPIGVQIQVAGSGGVGTLGCGVRDENGVHYLLSNRHVIRPPGVPIGAIVHQPFELPIDIDPTLRRNAIGRLTAFIPANPLGRNEVDAAVARLEVVPGSFRPTPQDGIVPVAASTPCYARDRNYAAPRRLIRRAVLGMPVMKAGRTSLFTTGHVTEVNSRPNVAGEVGTLPYVRQFTVEPDEETISGRFPLPNENDFGAPGDSGSLVVARFDSSPVGLLFAGGGGLTFCNNIDTVLEELAKELGVQELTIVGLEGNPQTR